MLNKKTIPELRKICKKEGIKGCSARNVRKKDIIALIQKHFNKKTKIKQSSILKYSCDIELEKCKELSEQKSDFINETLHYQQVELDKILLDQKEEIHKLKKKLKKKSTSIKKDKENSFKIETDKGKKLICKVEYPEEIAKKVEDYKERDVKAELRCEEIIKEADKFLKVYKIQVEEDYWTKCDICKRRLKKAIITDKGTMGYRCYLNAIGYPSNKARLTIDDLPNEAFEGIAEQLITEWEKLPFSEREKIILFRYNSLTRGLGEKPELEFPVRWLSNMHLMYHPTKGGKYYQWLHGSFDRSRMSYFARDYMGMMHEIANRVIKSETINNYWKKNVAIVDKYLHPEKYGLPQLPLGRTEKEMKKEEGWWSK